jgi:beta-galactosidase
MKSLFFRPGLAVLIFSSALVTLADTANGPRERVSFNAGWRFARLGANPDGSFLPEPGQPSRAVTASSEETDKGNTASMAFDGDSNTRWCAADGSMNQWLAVDFGKITPLGSVEIEWENTLAYQYKVEISNDGKSWKTAVDRTQNQDAAHLDKAALGGTGRFVRVTITGVPEDKWASIWELRVLDPAGNRLQPGGVPRTGDNRLQPVAPEAGAAVSPESTVEFNDSDWRKLSLPHDWGIEGPFKQEYPGETGKLPWWGIGWYR